MGQTRSAGAGRGGVEVRGQVARPVALDGGHARLPRGAPVEPAGRRATAGGWVARKQLFLRWALINVLTGVVAVTAGALFLDDLGRMGGSAKAALVIVAVFVPMTAYCGRLMWRADGLLDGAGARDEEEVDERLRAVAHDAGHVWFSVSLCQILGLLGTVAGFLIAMVGGFRNLESSDPQAVRSLLQHIADGSSTALLATLVGISASVVLALQHHLLVQRIERRSLGR